MAAWFQGTARMSSSGRSGRQAGRTGNRSDRPSSYGVCPESLDPFSNTGMRVVFATLEFPESSPL